MNYKIGIIADDFTGANDSGVQLAKKGFLTSVRIELNEETDITTKDVLVIDTDSRSLEPSEAFERVQKAAQFMLHSGYSHVYKKIDSTLRGNIGVEILAIEKVYKPDLVVIVPAFHKMGRTTKEGHHYINDELITKTEFAKDPKTPVNESYIPNLLYRQVGKRAQVFTAGILQGADEDFLRRLGSGDNWIVCDVEKESDFEIILKAFLKTSLKIVWVGSAGLIEYLPSSLGLEAYSPKIAKQSIGKTLTISGSLSSVTRDQLNEAEHLPNTYTLKVDVRELLMQSIDMEFILSELRGHSEVDHFLIYIDSSSRNHAGESSLPSWQISKKIVQGLGEIALAICEEFVSVNGLVLTGGDTAKAVCSELGVREMELITEVAPGLPFGRLIGYKREVWAVTKAGGFGTKDSLVHALQLLKGK
ncbi:four-carbon acid sugar kinase family protein [Pseudogracilibacillus auburnensis]|uniref:four-carbon acid sugar kinase family protein n=1 Tax=Pseudogracilibacillus auburnensis TaxID=1494959 RepID=UPI001A9725CE|nr:four-carbon acid sugar kinase family protein [Pseudogracilibacillus auburnensis]MBO1005079.1 four-carbon acid sugar kinase family protein [Pseudogracilibacillus auburnensis]